MLTRNVHYSEQPDSVMITSNGSISVIEFPINVTAYQKEDGEETIWEWVAEKVYSVETVTTNNLKERVESRYSDWLELAKKAEPTETTISDLVEAINALTDMVIGG